MMFFFCPHLCDYLQVKNCRLDEDSISYFERRANKLKKTDKVRDRTKIVRSIYLHLNYIIRHNVIVLDNIRNEDIKLVKVLYDRATHHIDKLASLISQTYKYNKSEIKYFKLAMTTLKKNKYLYNKRKAEVVSILNKRIHSNDICNHISNYLY